VRHWPASFVTRIGFRAHWVLIAASLLVPLALFGVIAWQDRRALEREAQESVDRGADSVREHALKVFETDALVIALIDEHIKSMSWAEIAASRESHDYLAELDARYPEIESVWIADGNGTVRGSSQFFPALSGNVSRFDFFRAARESKSVVFGGRVDTDFQNKVAGPHFFLAQRRTSRDGAFDGVIVLTFSSTYFQGVWRQSWHNAPQTFTDLTTSDFKVLAREPPTTIKQLNLGPETLATLRNNPKAGSLRTKAGLDRVERISAYRRVDPFDAYVIYGVDFDSVLRTWLRHLLVYGGIFGLAALGLTAVSLVAARHMEGERMAMRELAAETDKRLMTEKQLFEAEKLDAIGKVAGGFAHDFGNLLMAIQLNLDIVGDRVAGEAKEALDAIKAEVERGNEAIRSLMIFARHGELETDIVDAKARIGQMGRLLQPAIGTHATLEIWCEDGLWPIEINANQLELALLNLAVNARDAMRDGGKLRIAARNVSLSGAPDDLIGEFVEISVSDTGTGMPAEIASLAFDPFFTTKEEGRGTGLGLSQVYGFAKQAGGTATITSAIGEGTTVAIYIPKCASAAAQRKQPDAMTRAG
jgi:signal transduction histidine kinase